MNLCLSFQFLVAAWLSWAFTDGLLATPLGRALCAGLARFWLLRLCLQFRHFGALDPRSIVLAVLFAATCAACAAPLFL